MEIDYLSKSYALTKNINRGKRIRSFVVCRAFTGELRRKSKKKKISKITKKKEVRVGKLFARPVGKRD